MEVSNINDPASVRLINYEREKGCIQRKLANPQISDGKRDKLEFRLRDIDARLIPETVRNLN